MVLASSTVVVVLQNSKKKTSILSLNTKQTLHKKWTFHCGSLSCFEFWSLDLPLPLKQLVIRRQRRGYGELPSMAWQPAQQPAILSEASIMRPTKTAKLYPTNLLDSQTAACIMEINYFNCRVYSAVYSPWSWWSRIDILGWIREKVEVVACLLTDVAIRHIRSCLTDWLWNSAFQAKSVNWLIICFLYLVLILLLGCPLGSQQHSESL